MLFSRKRINWQRAIKKNEFDLNDIQNNTLFENQNSNATISRKVLNTQVVEQNISEHIQREMVDMISILYENVEYAVVVAANDIIVSRIEKVVRYNQNALSKPPASLANYIELVD